ncbi:hypothetical protein [Falsiroseomonas sp.]|uniref:hypothetical protein n=1 Tax=Falsiroseomonas sp. TaxID=2870721 RepID=UPI003F6EC5A2
MTVLAVVSAAVSALAAVASSYFSHEGRDQAYRAVVFTSQIEAATSLIAGGQQLLTQAEGMVELIDEALGLAEPWLQLHLRDGPVSVMEVQALRDRINPVLRDVGKALETMERLMEAHHATQIRMLLIFPREVVAPLLSLARGLAAARPRAEVFHRWSRDMADAVLADDEAGMRRALDQIAPMRRELAEGKVALERQAEAGDEAAEAIAAYLGAHRFAVPGAPAGPASGSRARPH